MSKTDFTPGREAQEQERNRKLRLRVRCGACKFLTKQRCQVYEAPCAQLGKTNTSASCRQFEADYSKIPKQASAIERIGFITRNMPVEVRHLVAYALVNGTEMETTTMVKLGFTLKLGQPVMVNLSAPRVDYVNCWYEGVAMGVTKDRKGLIVCSYLGERGDDGMLSDEGWVHSIIAMHDDNILPKNEWAKKMKRLTKRKLLNAPEANLKGINPSWVDEKATVPYNPPRMIQLDMTDKKVRKRVNKELKVQTGADGNRTITLT